VGRLVQAGHELREAAEGAQFEKEEYKFLLGNLRDQVVEIKKQQERELARVVREKEEEIVRSNRDILQEYGQLHEDHDQLLADFAKFRLAAEEHRAELQFVKNKEAQTAAHLLEREEEVAKTAEENSRYKKYLREIEASFKEVVELEEQGTKRVAALQHDSQQNAMLMRAYQTKNQELEEANSQLTEGKNQLSTQLEKAQADLKDLRAERVKLESINVELRLDSIAKQNDIHRLAEELKLLAKEGRSLKLTNDKLLGELNAATRKLVTFRTDAQRKQQTVSRTCRDQLLSLRRAHQELGTTLKREIAEAAHFASDALGRTCREALALRLQEAGKEEVARQIGEDRTRQQLTKI
jgi:chromosome segregation ATPase